MAKQKVTLAVDPKFFKNVFEKERMKIQDKIGIGNLSQAKFTMMIEGFKIREPKIDLSQVNTNIKRRKNDRI